ncbi:MAG: DUF411 domain-containing protein [Methylosarcina sp.]
MNSLKLLLATGLLILSSGLSAESIAADKPVDITVYRSPTCGCCGKWIDHLKQNNFNVKDILTEDMQSIKNKYGVPKEMASCHTAIVDNYVIEGHVPTDDISTLLKSKRKVVGLAVPGMVTGSPGMEMGGRKDPYDVMSFDKGKHFQIYNSYTGE